MGMQINTNLAANNAYRSLSNTQNDLSKSLEKLSSGLRINRAGDDAAGLALSEGLKSQIGGLTVASRNAQDGIGAIQTAEGGLSQAHSILQRLRDLGVQAANDTNNAESRGAIKTESDSLVKELDRISTSTNFNGKPLLNGSPTLSFQVDSSADAANQVSVDLSGANVGSIARDLKDSSFNTKGTSFAVDFATLSPEGGTPGQGPELTGLSFSSDKDGVVTAITTGSLNKNDDGTFHTFKSVDQFADALKADKAFSENFNVTVRRDDNGGGVGIEVTARNGGDVQVTDPNGAANTSIDTGEAISSTNPATGGLNFSTADSARASIELIDQQISKVSTARADLGASQNRLESAVQTINIAKENLTASNSRIRDTDMAEEMVKFTRNNILSQAGTAMLAQANQSNQGVLQLLR